MFLGCLDRLRYLSLCCNHHLTSQCLTFFSNFQSLDKIQLCQKQQWCLDNKENVKSGNINWKVLRSESGNLAYDELEEQNWLKTLFYALNDESCAGDQVVELDNVDIFRCNRTELNQFYGRRLGKETLSQKTFTCSASKYYTLTKQFIPTVNDRRLQASKSKSIKRKLESESSVNQTDLKFLKLYL